MVHENKLDLTEVPWPNSLLMCNRALDKVMAGERLVVVTGDPDVADSIRLMVKNQGVFTCTENHDNGTWILVVRCRRHSDERMS